VRTVGVNNSKSSKISIKQVLESQNSAPGPLDSERLPGWMFATLTLLTVAAAWAAYSNHFHNSFHFDDDSVIENNIYLRSLRSIPLFFQSATTFSSMPTNATYRPLTSVSFALDYWWGGGLNPFAFHVTQWSLHLLMGVLLFFFLKRTLEMSGVPAARAPLLSLFGAALFVLHRANTETVNFLTLRSEILSSLGILGSFVLFQYAARWRRSFLWLLPAIAGAFAKQSAIIFVLLFAIYVAIFPEELASESEAGTSSARWRQAALWLLPSLILAIGFYWLQDRLAGPRNVYGTVSPWLYLQTQTFAWLHYVRLFLIPVGQSADSDWTMIPHWYDTRVFAGVLFVALLFMAAGRWARRSSLGRAFLFGAAWFFVALIPSSSLFPLSEVINEHRPYVAYPGLILCLVVAIECLLVWIEQAPERFPFPRPQASVLAAAVLLLAAHGFGTHSRNKVWLNEETLWKDVTEASPGNGRAWMNYGLIFMARADFQNARYCFERAQALTPNYDILEINLGILDSATNQPAAESHFRRAVDLNQRPSVANLYYARWLHQQKRDPEAIVRLKQALEVSSADLEVRHLLMTIYAGMKDPTSLCSLASETLRIAPDDAGSAQAARSCSRPPETH
jgi:tetratricopeptide (TPR) repeat protein